MAFRQDACIVLRPPLSAESWEGYSPMTEQENIPQLTAPYPIVIPTYENFVATKLSIKDSPF